jgi:hypothetical protein
MGSNSVPTLKDLALVCNVVLNNLHSFDLMIHITIDNVNPYFNLT